MVCDLIVNKQTNKKTKHFRNPGYCLITIVVGTGTVILLFSTKDRTETIVPVGLESKNKHRTIGPGTGDMFPKHGISREGGSFEY